MSGQWRVQALLLAYPPRWRERYGDELEVLIEDLRQHGRRTAPIALDVLRGAVAAWLTIRRSKMPDQRRSALFAVLWSWVPFAAVAAWYGRDLNVTPTPDLAAAAHRLRPGMVGAYYVLLGAGVVAVAATAIAAAFFAVGVARAAEAGRRQRIYALMAVPPVIAAGWMGGAAWLARARLGHSAAGFPVVAGWVFLGVAGIAVSTWVATRLVRGAALPAVTWRVGEGAAVTVTAAMVVATGAMLAWGVLMRSAGPAVGGNDQGGWWLLVSAVMLVTAGRAVIALGGLRRGTVSEGG